jgi:menaquinone-dependent protoporphyrinogen oxidase
MRAIVVYASKYGSTKGIAEFIAGKLQERGIPTDVQEVGAVKNAADYDAFVIGSAVYMFHWLKEARQFVSKNRALLNGRPVWLFSSGPVGAQSKDAKGRDLVEVSGPKELDELRALVKPRDHRVFFGALYGERLTGMIGLGYRMAQKSKSAREAMPEGDFRDWKEIEGWANTIASALEAPNKDPEKVSSSHA